MDAGGVHLCALLDRTCRSSSSIRASSIVLRRRQLVLRQSDRITFVELSIAASPAHLDLRC
eukprot:1920204-Pleurochrysis_carterae.AAC.2